MESKRIDVSQISPYVRYVNYKNFESGTLHPERIIYDHEFIYCLAGEAVFLYDGMTYRVQKGDLFYLRPYLRNTMIVPEGKKFRVHCVHFDWICLEEEYDFRAEQVYLHAEGHPIPEEKLLARPNPEVDPALFPPVISGLDIDSITPLFRELYHNYGLFTLSARLRERALLLQIVAAVCELSGRLSVPSLSLYHQKTIRMALDYIQEYYAEPISLLSLAAPSGLSPRYFGQLFLEQTGMNVREYLTAVRIRNASRLLLHTDSTMEQIAANTGFSDKFYFSKVFKRQMGTTPGKYRKAYRPKDGEAEKG